MSNTPSSDGGKSALARVIKSAPAALRYLEPILAAQGDQADPELIAAQHALAELARSPANADEIRDLSFSLNP